ncbi:MAG: hypothetical protein QOG87_2692, partial [Actinomycetota bacterium]
ALLTEVSEVRRKSIDGTSGAVIR